MKRILGFIFMLTTLSLLLTACGSSGDTIAGTWIVSGYDCNGEYVSTNDISELYGENSVGFNKISIIFTKSGDATLIRPEYADSTEEIELSYTVQDTVVELYDPNEATDYELLRYDGDELRVEIVDGLTVILEKSKT